MSRRQAPVLRWAVLNCAVTQVLGLYATEGEARSAAEEWGRCSFAYELSECEALAVAECEAAR